MNRAENPVRPSTRWFIPAFALLVLLLARLLLRRRRAPDAVGRPLEPPLPEIAGGKVLFGVRLWTSTLLMFFVPTTLRQMFRHASGSGRASRRAVASPEEYRQRVRYSLPFADEWYVFNGGVKKEVSHSWEVAGQRYAYDFVIADDTRQRWSKENRGVDLEDYFCYGKPVLAPAPGVIVEVRDGIPDAPGPGTGWVDPFSRDFRGNFLTIQHAEGEYSFLAHLAPESICVKEGDRVERGEEVGRCGNSGHSTEPHLHFHVQDLADFFEAAGLPVAFDGVSVNGGKTESGRYLERGTYVSPQGR